MNYTIHLNSTGVVVKFELIHLFRYALNKLIKETRLWVIFARGA